MEKSRDLFFERGYENVSVQDICDAVEYGRSAVYAFFSSKEEIYAHIYVEAMRILADMFQSVNPAGSDFDREFLAVNNAERIQAFFMHSQAAVEVIEIARGLGRPIHFRQRA